ncbi:MAG: hypothetical protein U1E73_02220 [Planctomycetota bacterium]
MIRSHLLAPALGAALALTSAPAQEWTGDRLADEAKDFQSKSLGTRLVQMGTLLGHKQEWFSAAVARIHGDHREYMLKIERLLRELVDERWDVREQAERNLIEIGGRARSLIQQHKDEYEISEQHIRCARILDALTAKGTEQEERELDLLRGLVQMSVYLEPDPRLLRALRSALGHTDASVVEAAIRALGRLGGDDEVPALEQMLDWKGGMHRASTLAALARMQGDKALAACRRLFDGPLGDTETFVMLRALHARDDEPARKLLGDLASSKNPLVAVGAKAHTSRKPGTTKARFTLPDRAQVEAEFGGMGGDIVAVTNGFAGLPTAELAFGDLDVIDFPDHAAVPATGVRVFLNQGSLVVGKVTAVGADELTVDTALFGTLKLRRSEIQGMAYDPELDRLVGASTEHDRVRLRGDEFLDGNVIGGDATSLVVKLVDGTERKVGVETVQGVLFTRPKSSEPDNTVYTRIDLITGERLIAFIAEATGTEVAIADRTLGSAVIPLTQVARMELGVGGGALWGFTLIADYSDNLVEEVDEQGRVGFKLEDVFGAWDAECLDNGNLLITEFSVSRVQEVDRKGNQVWVYEDLKNPYDADRLPNGNTLIADTFGSRVIEVNKEKEIVWKYDKDIRPFDCDRLPNGNTLIADVLKDRVIEVNHEGEIVWEVKNLPNIHDADRLPNGNTLVTLRNKGVVLELDRDGNTVWELTGLSSPSDADRLPNGHTLVAENTMVREFDRNKNEVWRFPTAWAVEVNRY